MRKVEILATEQDGFTTRSFCFKLEAEENVDVLEAIKKSCDEYCKTEDGKETYIGNCNCFNYGDFDAYVPNSICEKYGIRKINSDLVQLYVNFDEQLVDESEIFKEE